MQWNQPDQPNPNPAAASQATPAANPWGPPAAAPAQPFYPQGNSGPVSTAQALRGIGAADVKLRYSDPPADAKFKFEVIDARAKNGEFGLAYVFEVGVTSSSTHPALVGQIVSFVINGFGNPSRQKNAVIDIKSLTFALNEPRGLTAEKAAAMSDEQWAQVVDAACPDTKRQPDRKSDVIGLKAGATTKLWRRPGTEQMSADRKNSKLILRFEKAA